MAKIKALIHRRDYGRLEELAAQGKTRKGIAASLAMTWGDFQKAIKGDKVATLRLEKGEAAHEQRLIDRLHAQAAVKGTGGVTPTIFLLKSRHRWNDRPAPEPTTISSNVVIQLPGAMPMDRYTKEIQAEVEPVQLTDGKDTDGK